MRKLITLTTGILLVHACALSTAQAQIGYLDAPSPINYSPTNLNSSAFTVSQGASVLVFIYGGRTQGDSPGTDPGVPNNLAWNGHLLTKAISQGSTASTWDDNAIYYLVNPPPGSGSFTGTTPTGVNQNWWMAYTITNVNTAIAPLTGSVGNGSAQTINNTVNNVANGDWAAVATSASNAGETLGVTLSPAGSSVVLSTTYGASGNATQTFGGASNCPSGSIKFTSTGSSSGAKMVLCEAIFAPNVPAPGTPTWVSATSGTPVQVDLTWNAAANASTYVLERGTNAGGPYTDFTNAISSATTNYIDMQVISGTTYYYVLAAENVSGTNFSTQISATPVGAPAAPVLGVGAAGAGNLALHWKSSYGATNYVIERATASGAETVLKTVTNNSYLDTGLTAGLTYYYEVVAQGSGGASAPSDEASSVVLASGWQLFDNFSLDSVGADLNGLTGSAGIGMGWTNLGGGTPITVTNGAPFGPYNYAQYTAGSVANIGDYEAGLGIAGSNTASTVFLEFSLPGIQTTLGNVTGAEVVAMNFDIDNSSPPGALTGQSATGPSAQFNYDNSSGGGFFRVNGANVFYYATISPNNTPYQPIPGDLYYFWFVINAAKGTYQIYLANGSMTGTNVDAGGLGAAPTLMWGTTSLTGNGSIFTYGFRNVTAGGGVGLPVNYIGTGPGSALGTVAQNEFGNIYVDQHSQNLTNPVTGSAAIGTPQIFSQPTAVQVYAGGTASFTVVGSAGVGFQWQSNGVNLVNGGPVSGATSSTLTISNVTLADQANYACIVDNPISGAFAASLPATLTVVTPVGAYETAISAAGAVHYYAFNDTNTTSGGTEPAYDFAGGDNGIYGYNTQNGYNGILGPMASDGFTGMPGTNYAASFQGGAEPNYIAIDSSWNLDTNTVTITAWIYPTTTTEPEATGIVVNRGIGADVEGLVISSNPDYSLGYNWNNDPNTYDWDSGIIAPAYQWSFVALTVTPASATITLMNTNGIVSSTHTYPHPVAPFAGTTMIGDDPDDTTGALTFNGSIDEVGIFTQALGQSSLDSLFTSSSGLTDFPATNSIYTQFANGLYPGETASIAAVTGGSAPLTETWQINGVNLSDGSTSYGVISGSATGDLTISNIASSLAGQTLNVTLVSSNAFGTYTSPPVSLTISSPNPGQQIYAVAQEAAGSDWNTGTSWSDGFAASVSVYAEPDSTYIIPPGKMERSPIVTNAVFPGGLLQIQGDGQMIDGGGASFGTETTIGELRLKESGTATATNAGMIYTYGGTVTFPNLQLAGGQIDNGSSSVVSLEGEIDVVSNSVIYADSASAATIRSYLLDAYLTGSGGLFYTYLGTLPTNTALVVTCPTNTFTGPWHVGQGALVGTSPNCLGTNSITVDQGGALETTYNFVTTKGSIVLNGQMYLYTADEVYGLTVNGSNVPPGTYTFAQLNAAFPLNFPATWPIQLGSVTGTNTGAGSITVLGTLPPIFTQQPQSVSVYPGQSAQFIGVAPNASSYQWWFTNQNNVAVELTDGGNISGSGTDFLSITNVTAANAGTYVVVASDSGGSTASSAAELDVLPTNPNQTITTTMQEPVGDDWNTATSWSDGLPVATSIYAEPNSSYFVIPGTMERTPTANNAVFPGSALIVQGDGVLVDGNSAGFPTETTTGELRLKESGDIAATNYGTAYVQGGFVSFPFLELAGGQIDNGNASSVALDGEIDVVSNSSIYCDSASAGSIRSMQINAYLTGSGTLTYDYMGSNYLNNDLIVSGTSNTFTGQWNVIQGGLLGNAANSLGTNSISIATNAMLETTYNYVTTNGTLALNGQMYLYTADTVYALSINGTAISPGTYSFAQLNSAYPSNFPSSWPVQLGSATGTNTGSGSIRVLTGPAPTASPATFSQIALSHGTLTFTGAGGAPSGTYHLLSTTNLAVPVKWTIVTNGTFDASGNFSLSIPVAPGVSADFYSIESP